LIHGVQRPRMPAEAMWDVRAVRVGRSWGGTLAAPKAPACGRHSTVASVVLDGGSAGGPGCCGCMEVKVGFVAAVASWCLSRLAAHAHRRERGWWDRLGRPSALAAPISHLNQDVGTRCIVQEIRSGGYYMGKVVVELKQDVAPTTCDNFRQLCEYKCYTGSMMQVWPEQRIEVCARRPLASDAAPLPTTAGFATTRLAPSPAASQTRRACVSSCTHMS
jgi:hypothetical protein